MQTTSQAIVLSKINFGEADLIVKTYTKEFGICSFLLKGIRKSKSKKFRPSYFQVLTILDLNFNYRENRNLQFITEAKPTEVLNQLYMDFGKTSMLYFIAEILSQAIIEESKDEGLFSFLKDQILQLEKEENYQNFHLNFMLQLSKFLGFYPDFSLDEFPYFNLVEGEFQLKPTSNYCFSGDNVSLLKSLHQKSYTQIRLNKEKRNAFIDFLILYYEVHLQGFKKPKSLEVLRGLF
ncbi:MAG: DNA repair protein RecO [Psychroflexus maritimus]